MDRDLIATIEENKRAIAGALADQGLSLPSISLSVITPTGCEAERNDPDPFEHISESMALDRRGMSGKAPVPP